MGLRHLGGLGNRCFDKLSNRVLQSATGCYSQQPGATVSNRVLQSAIGCYSQQSDATVSNRMLQSVTGCYSQQPVFRQAQGADLPTSKDFRAGL